MERATGKRVRTKGFTARTGLGCEEAEEEKRAAGSRWARRKDAGAEVEREDAAREG